MRFVLAAVLLQISIAAEFKAVSIPADGHVDSLSLHVQGYVRREHRASAGAQDAGLAQLGRQPVVSQAVEDATVAVNLTAAAGLKPENLVEVWKEEERQATTAMSLSLLASLSFVLAIFYMWNTPDLEAATRKVLVSSISLFSVVLLFMVLKKLWKLVVGSESGEATVVSDALSFLRFLVLFLIPTVFRQRLEKHMGTNRMRAFRMTGVHVIGFAGADAFSDILKLSVFSASPYEYLLGVLCMCALLALVSWGSTKLRMRAQGSEEAPLTEGQPSGGDGAEASAEAPQEATGSTPAGGSSVSQLLETMEIEIAGFVVGFLISMWARFSVTGAVPGARFGRSITGDDVNWLFCFCLLAFLITVVLARLAPGAEDAEGATGLQYFMKRSRRTFLESMVMSCAWLVFYLCQWLLWHMTADGPNGSHHTAKLTASNALALMASALTFLPMVMLKLMGRADWLVSNSEAFIKIAALVLGFSWETAVYMVVQGASEGAEGEALKKILGISMILLVLVSILPGWYMLMLPEPPGDKAVPEGEQAGEEKAAGEQAAS